MVPNVLPMAGPQNLHSHDKLSTAKHSLVGPEDRTA